MAFTQKLLEFDFALAQGVFQGGGNTATISRHRASVKIINAGGNSQGAANISIFGMTLSEMSQLSTYGRLSTNQSRNTVTIKAGEAGGVMTTVFTGTITAGYMDGNSQPDVAFRASAFVLAYDAAKPVPPTSKPGIVKVADLMSGFASQMGLSFENTAVTTTLVNPYLPGTAYQQALAVANHAGINWIAENGVLAIWNRNQARQGETTTISPSTGLVGYPAFNSAGIVLRTLFIPTLKYGTLINVQSSLQPACQTWSINRLEYELDSMVPNGKWFAVIEAGMPGLTVVTSN